MPKPVVVVVVVVVVGPRTTPVASFVNYSIKKDMGRRTAQGPRPLSTDIEKRTPTDDRVALERDTNTHRRARCSLTPAAQEQQRLCLSFSVLCSLELQLIPIKKNGHTCRTRSGERTPNVLNFAHVYLHETQLNIRPEVRTALADGSQMRERENQQLTTDTTSNRGWTLSSYSSVERMSNGDLHRSSCIA
jgi:hypothetical protein